MIYNRKVVGIFFIGIDFIYLNIKTTLPGTTNKSEIKPTLNNEVIWGKNFLIMFNYMYIRQILHFSIYFN